VVDGWSWFVLREKYCWLVADGWFVLREKYCWLVANKPSEQGGIRGEDVRDSGNGKPICVRVGRWLQRGGNGITLLTTKLSRQLVV
jgi:hypothetical protein